MEEEVAFLQDEFDKFNEGLNKSRQLLEKAIVQGKDYKDVYDSCVRFLDRTKVMIETIKDPKPTLETKKVTLEKFQVELQRIFDWQKKLDHFNQKGQLLSTATTNQKVIIELAQVSKKYEALLISAKAVIRKLETNYQEHHQHSSLIKDCTSLVKAIKNKSDNITPEGCSLVEYEKKLDQIQEIQKLVEKSQRKLSYILDLKERVIPNTHVSGILQVEKATSDIKGEIDNVMTKFLETKDNVTKNYHQLKDYTNQCDLIQAWMNNVSSSLGYDENPMSRSLAERKVYTESLRSHQRELDDWALVIKKLEECQFIEPMNSSDTGSNVLSGTIIRYYEIKEELQSTIERESDCAMTHEKYNNHVDASREWIEENILKLKSLSSTASQEATNLSSLEETLIPAFLNDLKNNATELDEMEKTSNMLVESLSIEGKEMILSCNNEMRSKYERLINDTELLYSKVSESLESETERDNDNVDYAGAKANDECMAAIDAIEPKEYDEDEGYVQQSSSSSRTQSSEIISSTKMATSTITAFKETVTSSHSVSLASFSSSTYKITDESGSEGDLDKLIMLQKDGAEAPETNVAIKEKNDDPLVVFDEKMSDLQKWLLNRRSYNKKLNQIKDLKTLEDSIADIQATLTYGEKIFADLSSAYESCRADEPGIIDEKFDRLEGEFSGFSRDMVSTITAGNNILPKCLRLQNHSILGAKVLEDSFAIETQSSKNREDIESNLDLLKSSADALNRVCRDLESSDLENVETDEHFITTVIDFVSIPAYGTLSQCQQRCRKLEELIEEHEKDLQSIENTEVIGVECEEDYSEASNTAQDPLGGDDEYLSADDESIRSKQDEIVSNSQVDVVVSEVRPHRLYFINKCGNDRGLANGFQNIHFLYFSGN